MAPPLAVVVDANAIGVGLGVVLAAAVEKKQHSSRSAPSKVGVVNSKQLVEPSCWCQDQAVDGQQSTTTSLLYSTAVDAFVDSRPSNNNVMRTQIVIF